MVDVGTLGTLGIECRGKPAAIGIHPPPDSSSQYAAMKSLQSAGPGEGFYLLAGWLIRRIREA